MKLDTYDIRKVIHYYYTKIQETNDPYYWYCLAETQSRAGLTSEAMQTIDNALSFPNPYPSKQELLDMQLNLQTVLSRQMNSIRTVIVTSKAGRY